VILPDQPPQFRRLAQLDFTPRDAVRHSRLARTWLVDRAWELRRFRVGLIEEFGKIRRDHSTRDRRTDRLQRIHVFDGIHALYLLRLDRGDAEVGEPFVAQVCVVAQIGEERREMPASAIYGRLDERADLLIDEISTATDPKRAAQDVLLHFGGRREGKRIVPAL